MTGIENWNRLLENPVPNPRVASWVAPSYLGLSFGDKLQTTETDLKLFPEYVFHIHKNAGELHGV